MNRDIKKERLEKVRLEIIRLKVMKWVSFHFFIKMLDIHDPNFYNFIYHSKWVSNDRLEKLEQYLKDNS